MVACWVLGVLSCRGVEGGVHEADIVWRVVVSRQEMFVRERLNDVFKL